MTKTYALFGDPVVHSLSPAFQNAALAAVDSSATYVARAARTREELRAWAEEVRVGHIAGANITLPGKEWALALADRATPLATAAGAANTWVRDEGALLAGNTDVAGLIATIEAHQLSTRDVVVLGAGGAARAALVALEGRCESVTVVNRTIATACELAGDACSRDRSAPRVAAMGWGSLPARVAVRDADLVIDATSLAHAPTGVARAAWSSLPLDAIRPGACLLSLSYGAGTATTFGAVPAGVRCVDGLCMLVHQGALSFTAWTGWPAPLEVMRDAVCGAVGRPASAVPIWPDVVDAAW